MGPLVGISTAPDGRNESVASFVMANKQLMVVEAFSRGDAVF